MPIFGSVATWGSGPELPDACILIGVFGVRFCATNEVVQFFVFVKSTPSRNQQGFELSVF